MSQNTLISQCIEYTIIDDVTQVLANKSIYLDLIEKIQQYFTMLFPFHKFFISYNNVTYEYTFNSHIVGTFDDLNIRAESILRDYQATLYIEPYMTYFNDYDCPDSAALINFYLNFLSSTDVDINGIVSVIGPTATKFDDHINNNIKEYEKRRLIHPNFYLHWPDSVNNYMIVSLSVEFNDLLKSDHRIDRRIKSDNTSYPDIRSDKIICDAYIKILNEDLQNYYDMINWYNNKMLNYPIQHTIHYMHMNRPDQSSQNCTKMMGLFINIKPQFIPNISVTLMCQHIKKLGLMTRFSITYLLSLNDASIEFLRMKQAELDKFKTNYADRLQKYLTKDPPRYSIIPYMHVIQFGFNKLDYIYFHLEMIDKMISYLAHAAKKNFELITFLSELKKFLKDMSTSGNVQPSNYTLHFQRHLFAWVYQLNPQNGSDTPIETPINDINFYAELTNIKDFVFDKNENDDEHVNNDDDGNVEMKGQRQQLAFDNCKLYLLRLLIKEYLNVDIEINMADIFVPISQPFTVSSHSIEGSSNANTMDVIPIIRHKDIGAGVFNMQKANWFLKAVAPARSLNDIGSPQGAHSKRHQLSSAEAAGEEDEAAAAAEAVAREAARARVAQRRATGAAAKKNSERRRVWWDTERSRETAAAVGRARKEAAREAAAREAAARETAARETAAAWQRPDDATVAAAKANWLARQTQIPTAWNWTKAMALRQGDWREVTAQAGEYEARRGKLTPEERAAENTALMGQRLQIDIANEKKKREGYMKGTGRASKGKPGGTTLNLVGPGWQLGRGGMLNNHHQTTIPLKNNIKQRTRKNKKHSKNIKTQKLKQNYKY